MPTFLIPGLLLLGAVGGSQTVAGVLHAIGRKGAPIASMVAGAILVGWIGVQVLLIWAIGFAHVLYAVQDHLVEIHVHYNVL